MGLYIYRITTNLPWGLQDVTSKLSKIRGNLEHLIREGIPRLSIIEG
jgi:hypothetical protein